MYIINKVAHTSKLVANNIDVVINHIDDATSVCVS